VATAELERARFLADVVDLDTGEVVFEANQPVPEDLGERIEEKNLTPIEVFFPDWEVIGATLSNTLNEDNTRNSQEALSEIYRAHAPWRPADARERPVALLRHVLRSLCRIRWTK
jgi:DNA-directed RNA polymerase subunit beta